MSASTQPNIHLQSYWRFRDLLEAAPDGIIEAEPDGTIVLLNAAAERMFGYQREELLGQLIEALVPDAVRHRHQEHRNQYAERPITRPMGIGLELFARRKDGSLFPVEISLSPIRSAQGSRVIAIVRDITNRKQAEAQISAMNHDFAAELALKNQQLEARNQEIERANRLKSDFLASMSHELRTPLHTIIGFSDLLAEELKGPLNADQKRFVGHIQKDARHLLELINDILDLSKIESGRLALHLEPFPVAEAITEVVLSLRPLAEKKRIQINELGDFHFVLTADRLRFKEIFYNLLSNAVKFTPDDGKITVECRQEPDGTLFCVSDTGIGINHSEQEAIFDKFYQLGSTTRGVREGTGLGLAITKHLVELHDGSIWVESAPGQGSRFQFFLPSSHAPIVTPNVSNRTVERQTLILLANSAEEHQELQEFLIKQGYKIVVITNPEQALQASQSARPLAVLLDWQALQSNTWGIMRDLQADEDNLQIPFLILTAAKEQEQVPANFPGTDATLVKPIEPTLLLRTIQAHILRLPGEPSRILVLDHGVDALGIIEEMLQSAGLLPVTVTSTRQALEILARSPISAVVVDLTMPDGGSVDLILRIRQSASFSQLPIIALDAKAMEGDLEISRGQKNIAFFKAPLRREDSLAKLHELLKQVTRK